jgi:hypothetical protein
MCGYFHRHVIIGLAVKSNASAYRFKVFPVVNTWHGYRYRYVNQVIPVIHPFRRLFFKKPIRTVLHIAVYSQVPPQVKQVDAQKQYGRYFFQIEFCRNSVVNMGEICYSFKLNAKNSSNPLKIRRYYFYKNQQTLFANFLQRY